MTWKGILTVIGLCVVLLFTGTVWTLSHKADMITAAKDAEIGKLRSEVNDLKMEVGKLKDRIITLERGVEKLNMVASWYGPGFHGRKASDGSIFNQQEFTCAHRTLPFGTILIIEYNGKRVPAVVTDRGPFITGRDIDLSLSLAQRLGFTEQGVVKVKVYQLSLS